MTLGLTGQEAKGGTDLNDFEGKKAKIENLEVKKVKFTNDEGEEETAWKLRVITAKVTDFETRDGDKVPVHASEQFPLKDETNYSLHPKAHLTKFLKKLKAGNPDNLVGKEVTLRVRTALVNNEDKEFLGFIRE